MPIKGPKCPKCGHVKRDPDGSCGTATCLCNCAKWTEDKK